MPERRETDLVRRAFLAPVLERDRAVGRREFFRVSREATNVQTMGYPGFSAFGDSPDDLKEPGGCEAGDVWSDRLDCLRDQQSNHAKRLEVAPSDHAGTAIRDKPNGTNPSRPGKEPSYQLFAHSCQAKIVRERSPFFPKASVSFHVFRRGGPEFFSSCREDTALRLCATRGQTVLGDVPQTT